MTTRKTVKANHVQRNTDSTLKARAVSAVLALPLVVACSANIGAGDDPSEAVVSSKAALSASDFMNPIPGAPMSAISGNRDLLVVCMDKLTADPMPTLSDIQTVVGKVQALFLENSGNRLSINNVMYRGCGGDTGTYKASTVDPPPPQQWTEALNQAVGSGFDFHAYDHNGDGNITGDELGIAVIRQTPADWDYGTERNASFQTPSGGMTANIADIYFSAGVKTVQWGLLGHELMHDIANAADLYGYGNLTMWRPGWYSLMDAHWNANHLDPIHKLKFGWTTPTVRTLQSQTFTLAQVETTGVITILADSHGSGEYFVIENRSKSAGAFDNNLPAEGVLVWRVIEDTNLATIYSPTGGIERWGWQLLTSTPLSVGQTFDLPWLEGATGYQLGVTSQNNGTASIAIVQQNTSSLLGFENGTQWTSPGVPLTIVSDPKTQGSAALQVGSSEYRRLDSVPFSTTTLEGITSKMALDIYVPSNPSNKYYLGAVQLYVNCPSANLYNAYVSQAELTGLSLGKFSSITFNLSSDVVNVMKESHTDFSFGIALNAPPASPNYVFDNLRFVQ